MLWHLIALVMYQTQWGEYVLFVEILYEIRIHFKQHLSYHCVREIDNIYKKIIMAIIWLKMVDITCIKSNVRF